ncbi:prepilin peptidase [soil metagenome]
MMPFLVAAVAVAFLAAAIDSRTGEIPNWLTLGPLVAGIFGHAAYALAHGAPAADALESSAGSLFGALACAVIPLILYRQDAIGGGDVKLLAALGAILQWRWGIEAEMYSFFAAGLLAPARLAYEGKLFRTLKNAALLAINPILPKAKRRPIEPTLLTWFRFGPAIFVGTCVMAYLHWKQ